MRALMIIFAYSQLAGCFLVAPRQLPAQPVRPRAAASLALRDDIKAAGVAVLTGLVLIASPLPAHAKGGGHGGGGHSHSSHHSSSSSSSSRRTLHPLVRSSPRRSRSSSRQRSSGYTSRSSTVVSSPPPPIRLYPDASAARREDGFYCPASLPRPGERVDVLADSELNLPQRTATVISSQPASQASLYPYSGKLLQPIPKFESDCSVTVKFDDGTISTVLAAEQPKSLAEEVAPVLAYGGYIAAMTFLDGNDDDDGAWGRADERHEKLLESLDAKATQSGVDAPLSGEYWGSSEESDEGDQSVRTKLTFGSNGSVTGRGRDGVDGSYKISQGRWGVLDGQTKPTVAWIEDYDEGFKVAVKGSYDAGTGKIKARFTSSRGVGGSFELVPKPSIF